LYFDGLLINNK